MNAAGHLIHTARLMKHLDYLTGFRTIGQISASFPFVLRAKTFSTRYYAIDVVGKLGGLRRSLLTGPHSFLVWRDSVYAA